MHKEDPKKEALESSVLSFWAPDIGYLGQWLVMKSPGMWPPIDIYARHTEEVEWLQTLLSG